MPSELGDLWAVQEDFLEAAVGSLNYIPVINDTLKGAPSRQVIAPPGEFVLDCEQVLVNLAGIGEAPTRPNSPLPRRHVTGRISRPTVNVVVSRACVPVGKTTGTSYTPPTPQEQADAAEQLTADGWAIWNGIFSRMVDGTLRDRCSHVEWLQMVPVGPSGAFGGWLLQIRFQLGGYLEESS